jgi:hypothetical protein
MGTNDVSDWMDEFGACKICGGEIPYGHSDNCCIYKMQRQIDNLIDEGNQLAKIVDRDYKTYTESWKKAVLIKT